MRIIMVGAPGAGKGTQAHVIAGEYGIPHISTGDIFRKNLQEGTELGMQAKVYMDQGALVPDEITIGMLMERISAPDCESGYILDGFPRNIPQAEALDEKLNSMNQTIDYVIDVEVPDEAIIRRMGGRRACPNCGETYHIIYCPSTVPDVCDVCGTKLILRPDDQPETVGKRLKVYHEQTQPLIAYYQRQGIVYTVDGTLEKQNVFEHIKAFLGRKDG